MGRGEGLSKELDQCLGRRVGSLLGEIVPAVDGKAAHVDGPFAPGGERIVSLSRDAAGSAPDREQGASDLLPCRARLIIVGEIGRAAGAVSSQVARMRTGSLKKAW